MKSVSRSSIWWPNLDKQIENQAKLCISCQELKQAPAAVPLHPWAWPTKPWQHVHVDFAGPFQDQCIFRQFAHFKWAEVFEMSQITATKTIAVLRHLFAWYGLPESIVTDNGPQFTSEDFGTFLWKNWVKHIRCAP